MTTGRGLITLFPMSARIENFLSKNKVLFSVLCAAALILPLAYGVIGHWSGKRSAEYDNKIYEFRNEVFEKYRDESLSSAEFLSRLRQLKGEMEGYRGLYPFLLHFSDEMMGREDFREAEEVLLWGEERFTSGHLLGDLFRLRLATVYEDTGRTRKAVDVLMQLTANGEGPLLLDKLYLDLGRLYLILGDREKAKAGLDYVLENSKESELLRLAKLMKEGAAGP